MQEVGGQVLDGHDGGLEIHFDLVLDLDAELDVDLEVAGGHDDALAGVTVDVGEFDDGDLRMDVELFPHDPLGPTAARAEHEDGGDVLEVVVFDPAGGVEYHGLLGRSGHDRGGMGFTSSSGVNEQGDSLGGVLARRGFLRRSCLRSRR